MKIAFLTSADPHDRLPWSGIHYYIRKTLEAHCGETVALGPVVLKQVGYVRMMGRLLRGLTGKRYSEIHCVWISRMYGKIFTAKLRERTYDWVFACSASPEMAFVETHLPIVSLADATFAGMLDYYRSTSNLLGQSKRQGLFIEKASIAKSSLLLYPSNWAAQSAIRDFDAPPSRTYVIPLGANLDQPPPPEVALGKRRTATCRLLFLGVEWRRKGGDVAVETLKALKKMGLKATLTVCGCIPPRGVSDPDLVVTGFLNKNVPRDRERLEQLLVNSDFLLAPTRAEAYGIVFCEASAYGLPSISRDTGGVSGVVRNGINGRLLPPDAGASEYARTINEIFRDETGYAALIKRTRAEYDSRLNWDAWGTAVSELIQMQTWTTHFK